MSLTFRMGFGSIMAPPGTYPIQSAMAEHQIGGDGPPNPAMTPASDEWIRRLGTLPSVHQPGEKWMYHTGADVLGVLIARVSGQSLETFLTVGRNPHDPTSDGFTRSSRCLSRFLDLGIPGD